MKFPNLLHGKLIRRYKRFLADILLDNGEEIIAHVPNSGAMTSTIKDGCDVWVSFHDNPKRKLKYTLELSKPEEDFVCTNTNIANKIGVEAIKSGVIIELQGYDTIKTEQKYGKNSRIDILLENNNEKCFVEIKSVSLKLNNYLAFPDTVTTRGAKHLEELSDMVAQGHRAVMLYVIQRTENLPFRLAHEIDKKYAQTFHKANEVGVEFLVYQSDITLENIQIKKRINANL